jgi:hypothetical protein
LIALAACITTIAGTVETHAEPCSEIIGPVQPLGDLLGAGPSSGFDRAQTFTVTQAGRIQAVEFLTCGTSGNVEPNQLLLTDLRAVVNGAPVESNSSALAYVEVPLSHAPPAVCLEGIAWWRIEFGDQGPLVQVGQSLAFVTRVNGNFSVSWRGRFVPVPGDAYAGGRMYTRSGQSWFSSDGVPDVLGPRNYDLSFRVITCDPAVPVTPMTWGRLKTHYY